MSDDHDLLRAILRAIAKPQVQDQQSLLRQLQHDGIELTQSTLSRKLKQFQVEKRDGRYLRTERSSLRVTAVIVVAPNLLVLKTEPGFAQALAARLDREPLPGQAGTVAGDDTVFVATDAKQLGNAERAAKLL